MRVIIEVNDDQELARALAALRDSAPHAHPVEVIPSLVTPSPAERKGILADLYERCTISLPGDWAFDREDAHER